MFHKLRSKAHLVLLIVASMMLLTGIASAQDTPDIDPPTIPQIIRNCMERANGNPDIFKA